MNVFTRARRTLLAALIQPAPLLGVHIHAERTRPIAQEEDQAIVLRLVEADALHPVICHASWRIQAEIECSARADSQAQAAETCEALAAAAWQRLAPLPHIDATPTRASWQHDAEDTPIATLTLHFHIELRALDTDLTALQP